MFRESLPIVVRNHIADLPFTKATYKDVFKKADQVWDSNRSAEPLPSSQVAAVSKPNEVAAVQKNKGQNKNRGQGRGQGKNQNGQTQSSGQNGQSGGQSGQNSQKPKPDKSKMINDDGLCKIHAKWKNDANFCAAPWGCRMKNVYKAPQ